LRSATMCRLWDSPVVPLERKVICGINPAEIKEWDLKKEIGKKGISSIPSRST
jgi:hypothetical protein